MNDSIERQIEVYIQDSIRDYHQNVNGQHINIFDRFIERCQFYYDQPAHSLDEIKLHLNKKLRGDIFEHFCQKYAHICLGFPEVWLLKDAPAEILTKLNLRRQDLGIDLIARDAKDGYYAIQAKYRKRTTSKRYSALTWNQLSTFHAMVSRSGPYVKHIIITNADYCRQFGRKTTKDKSICYGTLKNIELSDWMLMAGMSGRKLDETRKMKDDGTWKLDNGTRKLDDGTRKLKDDGTRKLDNNGTPLKLDEIHHPLTLDKLHLAVKDDPIYERRHHMVSEDILQFAEKNRKSGVLFVDAYYDTGDLELTGLSCWLMSRKYLTGEKATGDHVWSLKVPTKIDQIATKSDQIATKNIWHEIIGHDEIVKRIVQATQDKSILSLHDKYPHVILIMSTIRIPVTTGVWIDISSNHYLGKHVYYSTMTTCDNESERNALTFFGKAPQSAESALLIQSAESALLIQSAEIDLLVPSAECALLAHLNPEVYKVAFGETLSHITGNLVVTDNDLAKRYENIGGFIEFMKKALEYGMRDDDSEDASTDSIDTQPQTTMITKIKAPQVKIKTLPVLKAETPKEIGMPIFPVTPPAPPKTLVIKKPTFKSSAEDLRTKRLAFLDKLTVKIV